MLSAWLFSGHDKWKSDQKQKFEQDYWHLCHIMGEEFTDDRDKIKELYGIYKMNARQIRSLMQEDDCAGYGLYLK